MNRQLFVHADALENIKTKTGFRRGNFEYKIKMN